MSNTIPYSREYFPPAPILLVALAVPEGDSTLGSFSALVDTGSDGTFVSTTLLEELGVPVTYMTRVRSHVGENMHQAPVHRVDLPFSGSIRLPGIEAVGDDWGDQVIIGRNVLNKLLLLLNGPGHVLEVLG